MKKLMVILMAIAALSIAACSPKDKGEQAGTEPTGSVPVPEGVTGPSEPGATGAPAPEGAAPVAPAEGE